MSRFSCLLSLCLTGLIIGVMFQELAQNFLSLKDGQETFKMRFYVGHDGSMIRLASGLGIRGPLRWPALGSEFVFEVRSVYCNVVIATL